MLVESTNERMNAHINKMEVKLTHGWSPAPGIQQQGVYFQPLLWTNTWPCLSPTWLLALAEAEDLSPAPSSFLTSRMIWLTRGGSLFTLTSTGLHTYILLLHDVHSWQNIESLVQAFQLDWCNEWNPTLVSPKMKATYSSLTWSQFP